MEASDLTVEVLAVEEAREEEAGAFLVEAAGVEDEVKDPDDVDIGREEIDEQT